MLKLVSWFGWVLFGLVYLLLVSTTDSPGHLIAEVVFLISLMSRTQGTA